MKYVSDVAVASKMAGGDKAGRERESSAFASTSSPLFRLQTLIFPFLFTRRIYQST